jgi:hypothetical protein
MIFTILFGVLDKRCISDILGDKFYIPLWTKRWIVMEESILIEPILNNKHLQRRGARL